MYAICGATGNIGRAIAIGLLDWGKKVRAIARSREKLQSLVDKGAEPFVADLCDTDEITKAFTGALAVYAMIPPNMTASDYRAYQSEVGQSITAAIENAQVRYVVNLSSLGAHMSEGVGVVNGLHDQEQRLNGLEGVNVIHLRPTFFMENHLWQIETIKHHGMMATTQDLEAPVPQIATSDIANYAIARLTKLDFEGKITRELLGPADISMNEVAAAIGRAIGQEDLKFSRVSYEDTRNHMIRTGTSESVADGLIELYRAFDEGTVKPTESRSPENTTPTTIESFSEVFAQAYKA